MGKSICLVTATSKKDNYGVTANHFSAVAPNVPLGMLDAYLSSRDIPVVLIDSDVEGLTVDGLLERIQAEDPVLVGVLAAGSNPSSSTMSMIGILRFFDRLHERREHGFLTFVYGGHATVLPERTLRETRADFVVVGEGYQAVEGLYEHVTKGRKLEDVPGVAFQQEARFVQHPSPSLMSLDALPAINWDKMHPSKYRAHNWHCFGDIENRSPYAIVWTNQGCPYPCEFCCINNIFEKRSYRFRPMKTVVDEIETLVRKYGVRHLKILDELFIIKHPRIEEFCDLLEERQLDLNMWCFARTDSVTPKLLNRLKKVGLNWVAYGIETFNDDTLDTLNKRVKPNIVTDTIKMTRDAGIYICADVIAGLWDDDEAAIKRLRDSLIEWEFEWLNIYPTFAYPGTPLYDRAVREGVIETPKTWDIYGLYSYECIPMPTKHMSSAGVLRARDEAFSDYYKEPSILSMLERKFDLATRQHVEEMVRYPLKRRILESDADPNNYPPAGGMAAMANGGAAGKPRREIELTLLPSVV